jgi:predicted N-acetyltransferase YhbS
MMEIRPIRESEAVTFLQLVCDVFDLDFARARTVFFNEPFFDLNRKWALFEDGQMASVLTSVPLHFGWGDAVGIASVATKPTMRGRGYGTELLRTAIDSFRSRGEAGAYLFAQDPSMYVRMGFEPIDEMVRVPLPAKNYDSEPLLSYEEVTETYNAWADGHPNRLIRDDTRWKAWRWGMRACTPAPHGYVCIEGSVVREAIFEGEIEWPVGQMTDWIGLRSMCASVGLKPGERSAHLLALGTTQRPQMFLTDQF